jgi:hypothetical protein
VRAPAGREVRTGEFAAGANQVDVADVEEAILQTHVNVLAERSAHTGDDLPSELGLRVIDATQVGGEHVVLHLGNTAPPPMKP